MTTRFPGIVEKLERADENLHNLGAEVSRFFQECRYPVMPKLQDKEHAKALAYYRALVIPPRFSVLSGEIVHHLRSCLDHIIWELSDGATRNSKDGRYLEFPILETRPTPENKSIRYDRKIKGVQHVGALQLIEKFQPYHRVAPSIDPLWIVHQMDIADKHRELVLTQSSGFMQGPWELMMQVRGHLTTGEPLSDTAKREFDEHARVTPQISFRDFSGGTVEPIVPKLAELASYVSVVVSEFESAVV
jgi:hypothetical protein